jgi:hypothetical protein
LQVLLVLRGRVALHRTLGWFCVGWAGLMAVMGPWAALADQISLLPTQYFEPQFLAVQLFDLAEFLALLSWGILLRTNPAAHRRMMILSTIALADPGYARISLWLQPTRPAGAVPWFFYYFYGNVLLIFLMAAWDWWRGRLMRSFVIGAAALLAAEWMTTFLYFWPPWRNVTETLVRACARHSL